MKPRSGSSITPSTSGWLARICSTRVDPDRGRPTMKIGSWRSDPAAARAAKNAGVNRAIERRVSAAVSLAS